jgi:hypothetical protein
MVGQYLVVACLDLHQEDLHLQDLQDLLDLQDLQDLQGLQGLQDPQDLQGLSWVALKDGLEVALSFLFF